MGIITAVPADARVHPRLRLPARGDLMGDEVVLGQPLKDLSVGGCRLAGPGWESVGTRVQMVLTFPTLRISLPLQGVVVRSDADDMAVRFHDLNDEQQWALRKHIRDLQHAAAQA